MQACHELPSGIFMFLMSSCIVSITFLWLDRGSHILYSGSSNSVDTKMHPMHHRHKMARVSATKQGIYLILGTNFEQHSDLLV